MRITDDTVLQHFRNLGRCQWCHARCWPLDPHHVRSRGVGGSDVPANIVALCRACHTASHAGQAPRKTDLFRMIAERLKTSPCVVVAELDRLRMLPQKSTYECPFTGYTWRDGHGAFPANATDRNGAAHPDHQDQDGDQPLPTHVPDAASRRGQTPDVEVDKAGRWQGF